MNKVLIVVDMQNDFVYGSLGNDAARAIVPMVAEKIRSYRNQGIPIFFTRDTHYDDYPESHEGKFLPIPHCHEHSDGWQIASGLFETGDTLVNKFTFGYLGWDVRLRDVEEIEIIGVCTDVCVISNALILRSMYHNADIVVDASCCAGTTEDGHRAAIRVMETCHIRVTNQCEIGT